MLQILALIESTVWKNLFLSVEMLDKSISLSALPLTSTLQRLEMFRRCTVEVAS